MLQGIQNKKEKIIDIIHELKILADSFTIINDKKIFDTLLNEFKDQLTFNVLCLGDFSSGKSTFVNKFFIGEELLTTRHTTTTAKLCEVKYGDVPKLNIIDMHGDKSSYVDDLENVLAQFGAVDGENITQVKSLELEVPSEILKEGVVVVDSPGLNDPEIERMEVTFDYIDRADCILYFLNAQQAWKKNEKDFLEEKILRKKDLDKIFFILNYWDMVEGDGARKDLLGYVNKQITLSLEIAKTNLMETNLSDLPLIPVSSKTKENFNDLQDELGKYFVERKGKNLIEIKAKKISALISRMNKRFEKEISIVRKDEEEIDDNLKTIAQEYQCYRVEYEQFKEQVHNELDKLWTDFIKKYDKILEEISRDVGRNLTNRLRSVKNEKDLQQLFYKNIKNTLYQRKVDFQRLELELMACLQQSLKKYKARLNLETSLLDEYCLDNFNTGMTLEIDYSDEEFIAWAVGGAFGASALMLASIGTFFSTFAPIIGVPVLLAGFYYGNLKDKEKLQDAKGELMENLDQKIYEILSSEFHYSLNDGNKKKELFETIYNHIDSEIIEAFKDKEAVYLRAKEIKGNKLENEKIVQLTFGLEQLVNIDNSLHQVVES